MIKPFLSILVVSSLYGQVVTVTPGTTYQTIKWWIEQPGIGPGPNGVGVVPSDSNWSSSLQVRYLGQMVNQLGMNTLQVALYAGDVENTSDLWSLHILGNGGGAAWATPINDNGDPSTFNCSNQTTALGNGGCSSAFPMGALTTQLGKWWFGTNGMRQMILSNGRIPYLVVLYVGAYSYFSSTSPNEYAEQVLAAPSNIYYTYCSTDTSGTCMPYAFIPWNEPDITGMPDAQNGANLEAAILRLNANGFFPQVWCCSPNQALLGVTTYNNVVTAMSGSGVTINTISTHQYFQSFASDLANIYTAAQTAGINAVQNEFDGANIQSIFSALQNGMSGYSRDVDGRSLSTNPTGGSSCVYLFVSVSNPYQSNYTNGTEPGCSSPTEPTFFWPQIMHYVHPGAVRVQTSITNGTTAWDTVAFRNPGTEGYAVVVRSWISGDNTVQVNGLPAGTYQCTWTTSQYVMQPCSTPLLTIGNGGTLHDEEIFPSMPAHWNTNAVMTFVDVNNNPNIGHSSSGAGVN